MDIKGLARNLIPLPSVKALKESASARSKTDANNDREGNGQSSGSGEEKRRKLTPEEVQEAVKFLEGLPGIKDNSLRVRLDNHDGIVVVLVEDRDGKVVRRIPENELAHLTSNRQKKSGHLLNKAL